MTSLIEHVFGPEEKAARDNTVYQAIAKMGLGKHTLIQ
jgi:hypothetical protein